MGSKNSFSRFESLGDNCEFGFFLRQAGNEISSLFRWTSIVDFHKLNSLIQNKVNEIFNFEDLSPLSEHMVLNTKHSIGFHTRMKSDNIDGKQVYRHGDSIVKGLYLTEVLKIKHLRKKFIQGLTNENRIYVVKGANSEEVVTSLAKTIASYGKGKVLHVVASGRDSEIPRLTKIEENLYCGSIDCFANYNNVDELSFRSWEALLETAIEEIP